MQSLVRNCNQSIRVNSFVMAAFISIGAVYEVMITIGMNGISSYWMLFVCMLGYANFFLKTRGKISCSMFKPFFRVELFLTAACVLTAIFAAVKTQMTFMRWFLWVFSAGFFASLDFDVERVLRYAMCISLVTASTINQLLANQVISIHFAQTNLGIIYDLLPCVVIAAVHFVYYRDKSNWFTKACYLYYLYVLIIMLMVIVRGALLSLIIGVIFMILNRPDKGKTKIQKRSAMKNLVYLLFAAIGVVAILNYEKIIEMMYLFLESKGINFGVITKFYIYMNRGDVMDGREKYYNVALEWFAKSPLWGNGIQTYYAYPGDEVPYPHNYILQFLFEGGVLLAVPLCALVIGILYNLVMAKYQDVDDAAFLICLAVVALIPGLFSMDMWGLPSFWIAIVYSMAIHTKKNVGFTVSNRSGRRREQENV